MGRSQRKGRTTIYRDSTTQEALKAGAGGAGGSWYVLLQGIAALVQRYRPAIQITVVEGGGVVNHAQVGQGVLPMGILNPPMTIAALAGGSPYNQAYPELRVGVCNLTTNHLQFVVDRSLPIGSLEEWAEQRYPLRIPVDRPGTVDRLVFDIAMQCVGITEQELDRWGGELVPALNYHEQLAMYREGRVDALWQFMGVPSPSILEAHTSRPLKMLPLSEKVVRELASRGWSPAELSAEAYGMDRYPVPTVAMNTTLGFNSAVPADLVFSIVQAICDHYPDISEAHEAAAHFTPSEAPRNPGGPLHPGAERYYRISGLL